MFSSYPLIKEVLTRYICKILIPSIDEIGISSTLFIKLSMLTVVSFAKFKIPDLSVPSFLTICTIGAFIEVGRLVKSRMNNNNSRCFSSIGSTVSSTSSSELSTSTSCFSSNPSPFITSLLNVSVAFASTSTSSPNVLVAFASTSISYWHFNLYRFSMCVSLRGIHFYLFNRNIVFIIKSLCFFNFNIIH